MKSSHRLLNAVMIVIIFLPVVYLGFIFGQLPAEVPLHFNARMEPDRMGNKSELWLARNVNRQLYHHAVTN